MGLRLFYLFVTVFFLTMNVLLWRTDITGRTEIAGRISPRLVWEKALTAAGDSSLEIRYRGKKIGTAHWQPSVVEAASAERNPSEEVPEGMVESVSSYNLEFDGQFTLDEFTRLRFGFHLKLDTNYTWHDMSVRLGMRPYYWEVHADASAQALLLRSEDENGKREKRFTFADLEKPEKLFAEFGQPWLAGTLAALGFPLGGNRGPAAKAQGPLLTWQARNDSFKVQHVRIRGYQLQGRFLDRYSIRIFVNPAGEILRLELPGDIVLLSEALTNL